MMKSSIPSSCGLDPRGAVGLAAARGARRARAWRGAAAIAPASIRPPPPSRGARLDVLDRLAGRALDALDQLVGAPTSTSLVGQRRDHDLRDVEVLHGVHRRRVGVGVADHARRPRCPSPAQRRRAACAGARAPRATARPVAARPAGTTTMKRCGPSVGELLEALDELAAGGRLVGEHERDVERQALGVEVDHDVRRPAARSRPRARSSRSRRSQPEAVRGQRRDDDLVDAVRRAIASMRGVERVGVADLAGALDALVAHEREREVDAHLRASRARPRRRSRCRGAGASAGRRRGSARRPRACALADRVEQLRAADRLVGEDEDRSAIVMPPSGSVSPAAATGVRLVAPPRPRAGRCRGPRRGRRTRTGRRRRSGTRSKLKIGGGEETCHSSVSARHGLASARGPPRQLARPCCRRRPASRARARTTRAR